jgi:carbamoylphosphate synthase large subunit
VLLGLRHAEVAQSLEPCWLSLEQNGTLDKYNVELLGAKLPSINRAEDRNLFKQAMTKIGLKTPQSGIANTMEEALQVQTLPCPSAAQS